MWASLIGEAASMTGGSSIFRWAGVGLIVLALVAAFGWLGWSKAQAEAERDQARAELAVVESAYRSTREAYLDLQETSRAQQEALTEREMLISEINAQREALRLRWQEAVRHEPKTRTWADTALPDAVRGLLQ